ncbi:MAG TPA: TIGR01459 family HAD-type hydrolase [Xanthobacteraceae bacterium]|nr:TIGR01459 family HAD-type hydrolase [Xanthobacteraceae bacterium]
MNSPNIDAAIPPVLEGFGPIAPRYKLILSDVWGVVHNGETAYPAACAALKTARENGATVILISNAPRPGVVVAKQIARWGVPDDCYDTIVASGDVARTEMEARPAAKIFHLGPERDLPNYDGLPNKMVGEEECDLVVVTGPFNDEVEGPDDYREMFARLRKRNVLMLCANPDIVVERGDKLIWCAGALAQVYEELGGKVVYAGKPHGPIYDLAFLTAEKLRGAKVEKNEVLAIGDGARTDLKGAALQGIDCLFITGGIHAEDFSEEKNRAGEIFAEQAAWPIGMMHRLRW